MHFFLSLFWKRFMICNILLRDQFFSMTNISNTFKEVSYCAYIPPKMGVATTILDLSKTTTFFVSLLSPIAYNKIRIKWGECLDTWIVSTYKHKSLCNWKNGYHMRTYTTTILQTLQLFHENNVLKLKLTFGLS